LSAAVEHEGHHVSVTIRLRTTALGAALLVFGFAVSACGGSKADATEGPSEGVSVTSTPTPTPTPTPTSAPSQTAAPLSSFEDRPQVRMLRQWAAAVGQDINRGDKDMPRSARFETEHGRQAIPQYAAEDIGLRYPGPAPFTPVSVTVAGDRATVSVCWWSQGWARDPKTGKPARKRKIDPASIRLRKSGGLWRLDDLRLAKVDCSGVVVRGVRS
jgi:hypothetical protein